MEIRKLLVDLYNNCMELPNPYRDYVLAELERIIKYTKVKNKQIKERKNEKERKNIQ